MWLIRDIEHCHHDLTVNAFENIYIEKKSQLLQDFSLLDSLEYHVKGKAICIKLKDIDSKTFNELKCILIKNDYDDIILT
jgi:hypothetical protein